MIITRFSPKIFAAALQRCLSECWHILCLKSARLSGHLDIPFEYARTITYQTFCIYGPLHRPDRLKHTNPFEKRILRKGKRIFLLAFFIIFVLPVSTLAAASEENDALREHLAELEENPFVTEAVFKNGLKILVNEHRAHPVVAIQVVVDTGFEDPTDTNPGLKSLLAAMFFRREKEEGEGTLQENAHLMGALLSSAVGYRDCRFEIQAPAQQWKNALRIHSQAILDSAYDTIQIEREAALLRLEARRKLELPSVSSLEGLVDLGFGSSVKGRWTTILEEDLDAASGEKLTNLHRKMFAPEGMILVISGDINAIEVLNEAAVLYGGLSSGVHGWRSRLSSEQQGSFRYRKVERAIRNPQILFGFHVPGNDSPDFAALEVLNAILGLGRGSVLQARLQNQKKLIFNGTTKLLSRPGSGYLIIRAVVPPENIDRSEIAVLVELELLKRKVLDDADMERAWAQLERSYREEIQTVSGRARILAQFEIEGDWKQIDRHISEIRKVGPADIRRVAEKYFRMENCSLLEYLPVTENGRDRTLQSVRSTLDALLYPATNQEEASREREVVLSVEIPKRDDDYRFSWVQYPFRPASILRGPEVYIREDHTTPLLHMGLFFPGGRLDESEEKSGLTNMMVPLMLKGTLGKDTSQFHRQLEIYGGRIQPVVEEDYFGFYFSIPSKNFRSGFSILMDILKAPAFEEEAIDWYKTILNAERAEHKNDRDSVNDALRAKLFIHFPYSRNPLGASATLAGITADSLKTWYDRHIRNRKPLVVITGDSEGTSLASYFIQPFSGSRFLQTELTEEFAPVLNAKGSVEETWDKDRSLVGLGFHAPPVGDRDFHAAIALQNHLLQTMQATMEEDQLLKLLHIAYEPMLRGGRFIAFATTSTGSEESALETLRARLYKSITGSYTYRDYRSALNRSLGYFRLRQQHPFLQITDVALNVLAGEGIEGYQSFLQKIQGVLEEDIKNTAKRIFQTERAVSLRIYGTKTEENSSAYEKLDAMEN